MGEDGVSVAYVDARVLKPIVFRMWRPARDRLAIVIEKTEHGLGKPLRAAVASGAPGSHDMRLACRASRLSKQLHFRCA